MMLNFLLMTQSCHNFNASDPLSEHFPINEVSHWLADSSHNFNLFNDIVVMIYCRFVVHYDVLIWRDGKLWIKSDCISLTEVSLSSNFNHRMLQSDFEWIQLSLCFHLLIVQWCPFYSLNKFVAEWLQLGSDGLILLAKVNDLQVVMKFDFLLL